MAAHSSQFDDHFVFNKVKAKLGLKYYEHRATKVRKTGGQVGQAKKQLPAHIHEILADKWEQCFAKQTGVKTYAAVRTAYKQQNPAFYDDMKLLNYFDDKKLIGRIAEFSSKDSKSDMK
jgi:hypothetical protein